MPAVSGKLPGAVHLTQVPHLGSPWAATGLYRSFNWLFPLVPRSLWEQRRGTLVALLHSIVRSMPRRAEGFPYPVNCDESPCDALSPRPGVEGVNPRNGQWGQAPSPKHPRGWAGCSQSGPSRLTEEKLLRYLGQSLPGAQGGSSGFLAGGWRLEQGQSSFWQAQGE